MSKSSLLLCSFSQGIIIFCLVCIAYDQAEANQLRPNPTGISETMDIHQALSQISPQSPPLTLTLPHSLTRERSPDFFLRLNQNRLSNISWERCPQTSGGTLESNPNCCQLIPHSDGRSDRAIRELNTLQWQIVSRSPNRRITRPPALRREWKRSPLSQIESCHLTEERSVFLIKAPYKIGEEFLEMRCLIQQNSPLGSDIDERSCRSSQGLQTSTGQLTVRRVLFNLGEVGLSGTTNLQDVRIQGQPQQLTEPRQSTRGIASEGQ